LDRIDNFVQNLREVKGKPVGEPLKELLDKTLADFEEAMDDDLNIAPALGALFSMMKTVNVWMSEEKVSAAEGGEILAVLKRLDTVLGVMSFEVDDIDADIQGLIDRRTDARKKKDWAEADRIRSELEGRGIVLQDKDGETIWRREKL
jgi:cysteinyl-tRNA synthetase